MVCRPLSEMPSWFRSTVDVYMNLSDDPNARFGNRLALTMLDMVEGNKLDLELNNIAYIRIAERGGTAYEKMIRMLLPDFSPLFPGLLGKQFGYLPLDLRVECIAKLQAHLPCDKWIKIVSDLLTQGPDSDYSAVILNLLSSARRFDYGPEQVHGRVNHAFYLMEALNTKMDVHIAVALLQLVPHLCSGDVECEVYARPVLLAVRKFKETSADPTTVENALYIELVKLLRSGYCSDLILDLYGLRSAGLAVYVSSKVETIIREKLSDIGSIELDRFMQELHARLTVAEKMKWKKEDE